MSALNEPLSMNLVLDALYEEVAVVDRTGAIVSVNNAWKSFADENGLTLPNHGVGLDYFAYCGEATAHGIRSVLNGEAEHFEYEYDCHSAEQKRWFTLWVTPIVKDSQVLGAAISHINITRRKEQEEMLRRLAYVDDLTHVPNRRYFRRALLESVRAARHRDGHIGVLMVDCDNFKRVNDTFGHATGDAFLTEVSRRLVASVRDDDVVARYGGDEFVICLSNVAGEEDLKAITTRIANAFQSPLHVHGQELNMSVSVGAALYPDDSLSLDELVRLADVALYRAKGTRDY